MNAPVDRRRGQQGLSLVELLVSTALLAVIIVTALGAYDLARQQYAQGENVSEQQQLARIAYDMIAREMLIKFQMSPNHPMVDLRKAYAKF